MGFAELRRGVLDLYREGRYEDALEVLSAYQAGDEDEEGDLFFWRACLLSRAGRARRAVEVLAEALERGHWWSEARLRDPDLDPLRGLPRWPRLVEECRRRFEEAEGVERHPVVLEPAGRGPGEGWTLVVLHGRATRAEMEVDHWAACTARGWRVVAPGSSQPLASNRYGWDDRERAERDVERQLGEAGLEPGAPVVMGGYSQGAMLALHLAAAGHPYPAGLVLVAPSPLGMGTPDAPIPVPTWVGVGEGEAPEALRSVEELLRDLEDRGVPLRRAPMAGTGHDYPPDFTPYLEGALAWIQGRD